MCIYYTDLTRIIHNKIIFHMHQYIKNRIVLHLRYIIKLENIIFKSRKKICLEKRDQKKFVIYLH